MEYDLSGDCCGGLTNDVFTKPIRVLPKHLLETVSLHSGYKHEGSFTFSLRNVIVVLENST